MEEVKCIGDIEKLREEGKLPNELIEKVEDDLHIVHEWSDMDEECCFEDFDADDFGYGHIAIFDGKEEKQDYEKIGLTGGLKEITPETVEEWLIGGVKWTRLVVVYNDSYSMILWLKESVIFRSFNNASNQFNLNNGAYCDGDNRKLAVGSGVRFNIFDLKMLNHIKLKKVGIIVEVEGERFSLHKGKTFLDSIKIDKLLDAKGDLEIKKYISIL